MMGSWLGRWPLYGISPWFGFLGIILIFFLLRAFFGFGGCGWHRHPYGYYGYRRRPQADGDEGHLQEEVRRLRQEVAELKKRLGDSE